MSVQNRDKVVSKIKELAGKSKRIHWSTFLDQMSAEIIETYNGEDERLYQSSWKNNFKEACKKLKIIVGREDDRTDQWAEKITPFIVGRTIISNSSSVTSSTSSLSYQSVLGEKDQHLLQNMHKKIKQKWILNSGTVVEDKIYSYIKDFQVEHSLHSYVLRIDDQLNDIFPEEDIDEIKKDSGCNPLKKELPKSLTDLLLKLRGKSDLTTIDEEFQNIRFHRINQPAEYWCRNSVLNYLDLFIQSDTIKPFFTEQDLLDDMYGFIKTSRNISKTTTQSGCQSNASSINKNMRRDLGKRQQLERMYNGDRADLTFKYLSLELGCVEIGLVDHGEHGTKELQEARLKCPKMMRSYCKQIVEQFKITAEKVKIAALIINGPFITAQVMTFTKGSVGILFTSPRLKMPESINQIPALLPPVLALIYNCALIVKETAQLLQDESSNVNLDPFKNTNYFFPDSFVPKSKEYSYKKRKAPST
ncbi:unnamed protein product [Mucor hiemalis]